MFCVSNKKRNEIEQLAGRDSLDELETVFNVKLDPVSLLEAKLLLGNTRDGVVDLYGVDMDLEWYIVCLKKPAPVPNRRRW